MKTTIIGGIISGIVVMFVGIILNRATIIFNRRKQQRKDSYKMKQIINRRNQINENHQYYIDDEIKKMEDLLQDFDKNWKSKLPSAKERIALYNKCIRIQSKNNLTIEQKERINSLKRQIYKLYNSLFPAHLSKKEKRLYYLQGVRK